MLLTSRPYVFPLLFFKRIYWLESARVVRKKLETLFKNDMNLQV